MTADSESQPAPQPDRPTPDPALSPLPALAAMGVDELIRRREVARGLVQDDGVVVGSDGTGRPRHLNVDPVPLVVPASDWAGLEAGLRQRAELLDLLLADIYGPRRLVADGVLPAELVIGHPGFVPQADGIATRHGLCLTAADLGRDDTGSWRVLADRAQAPVGAGYAMAVRRITARTLASVHRETDLRRLREFFDTMRIGMQELANGTSELPRVVLLSGCATGEAFDEVFTAMLLGLPVVRAEELSMRGGRIWLTTTERPEPVDVIVRRVTGEMADPLDLQAGSTLGVPGLVEAGRRGVVTVVNPVGAAVLEDPALAAFLETVAARLLGEDLRLSPVRTWWCGERGGFRYTRDNLADLVLSPIAPTLTNPRVFVRGLSAERRADLWARVESEPWAWCGQEVLPTWQLPVVTHEGLSPRAAILRTFTISDARGTMVMPGGLTRLAAVRGCPRPPVLRDAVVKDVWVLRDSGRAAVEEAPMRDAAVAIGQSQHLHATPGGVPLSARAAEDLYWFGRYAERAESTARLLLVVDDLVEDHVSRPGTDGHVAMRVLVAAVDAVTTGQRDRSDSSLSTPIGDDPMPEALVAHLTTLVFDDTRRGTVSYSARRAARAATEVRELLSADTWLVLSRLDRALVRRTNAGDELQSVLALVVEAFLALTGMGSEGLVRDASWAYFDAGRRVERAQETVRILRRTLSPNRSARVDRLVLDAVLRSRDSLLSHRRRGAESGSTQSPLAIALDLLLLDSTNPRSVRFQLDRLREDLGLTQASMARDAVAAAMAPLTASGAGSLAEEPEHRTAYLRSLDEALRRVSSTLDSTSFRHRAPQRLIQGPR